jgi:hypothetical protein
MSSGPALGAGDYLDPVFVSIFTNALDLDLATRLWDVFVFEGDAVLVRAAVALLGSVEGKLYGVKTKKEVYKVLEAGLSNQTGDEGALLIKEDDWMRIVRDAGKESR